MEAPLNLRDYSLRWLDPPVILALLAAGLFFWQNRMLRLQTKTMREAFDHSTRPFAFVDSLKYEAVLDRDNMTKVTYTPNIKMGGEAQHLIYLGTIRHRTTHSFDFRKAILSGNLKIKDCILDGRPPETRQKVFSGQFDLDPLVIEDRYDASQNISTVDLRVYSLFLYEDAKGNLFDTLAEYRDSFTITRNGSQRHVNWLDHWITNEFHEYSGKQRKQLASFLGDHVLARIILRKSSTS